MTFKRALPSTQSVIFLAFAVTALLISILVATTERMATPTLKQTTISLQQQYEKMFHLIHIQRAGMQRTIDAERILLDQDPFAQDEALLNLYAGGRTYMAHRDRLMTLLEADPQAQQWLLELNEMAKDTGPMQERIARMAINGNADAARQLLFSKVISQSGQYDRKITAFLNAQDAAIDRTVDESRSQVNRLINTTTVLAGALIAVGILFSAFIVIQITRVNRRLHRQKDSLAQELKVRSQDLVQTQALLMHQNRMLERLSSTDQLTGLLNHLKIEQTLERLHDRFEKQGTHYSVLLLDLDYFKSVNDAFGHTTGDEVLQTFAKLLTHFFQDNAYLGRWGGEAFIAILEKTELETAESLGQQLLERVQAHRFPSIQNLTASAGLACVQAGESSSKPVHRANMALQESKSYGRNRLTVSRP